MPEEFSWKCSICGEEHSSIPWCFSAGVPIPMEDLSDEEKETVEIHESCASATRNGETTLLLRGHIEIPVLAVRESFCFSCWYSVEESVFEE